MKDMRELRYPTSQEMKDALEAAKKGPEAVLEFLRKGSTEENDSGDATGEERPETV